MVCRYLLERGHRILERNWRHSHLEIDIISIDAHGLHIIEVKSRTLPELAEPEQNVDYRKKARLVRAAKAYLSSPQAGELKGSPELFFDVATVEFAPQGDGYEVKYYPQAFIPMYL